MKKIPLNNAVIVEEEEVEPATPEVIVPKINPNVKYREPQLLIATGKKGVGKTYETIKRIDEYVKDDPAIGKKGRSVLIYDINREYVQYKTIGIAHVQAFSASPVVEVRRILPIDVNTGQELDLDGKIQFLNLILRDFRGGLLVVEDINKYVIAAKTKEIIGAITTNRHRDQDIICHFQSLSPLDPRMWQNVNVVRFHYQIDPVFRYKQRIPNYELFAIAQNIVNYNYLIKGKTDEQAKRFFLYVHVDENIITGNFTPEEFIWGCQEYLKKDRTTLNYETKSIGHSVNARKVAEDRLVRELFLKYYGN